MSNNLKGVRKHTFKEEQIMKFKISLYTVALLPMLGLAAAQPPVVDLQLQSYAVAVKMARDFQKNGLEIDVAAFHQGLQDALASPDKVKHPEATIEKSVSDWRVTAKQKIEQHNEQLFQKNTQAASEFLAKNRKMPGIVELNNGVQVEWLQQAKQKIPPAMSQYVEVHYIARKIDGSTISSSKDELTPFIEKVEALMPGWRQAVLHMSVGDKAKVFVPADQAFGKQGLRGKIEPGELHILEMELIAIKDTHEHNHGDWHNH
ncbi:FKBP-type peptidyl-prolyl cis-trans isomerase N-terminal domain-containing protein [Rheinheimera soli]|uniref:Peptidyl-prolyl cis-trans isomerase n=1 Tax=Rheinheimera soli TaxID=443616 RepID=A0ABU1W4Z9_9GAMM|nr:FKBP-type peptidyl-prolyl cis-trans isomerase N-terminal domain-containing protein [Rheinheimera soli]MDR7123011.1 FKBP-type peptidyl-prolyl cis-trans isomerase FklB [Rheinheimera soli]